MKCICVCVKYLSLCLFYFCFSKPEFLNSGFFDKGNLTEAQLIAEYVLSSLAARQKDNC